MGKSWRERIVEARARGEFSQEDHERIRRCQTCVLQEIGVRFFDQQRGYAYTYAARLVDPSGGETYTFEARFMAAMGANDFAGAERILDDLEDRALELKRAGGSDAA